MFFFLLGASLAQDRGRLEARIEVLGTELETQKKQSERDNDALKIKTKIIDDQTETIRKLKEVAGYFIEISKSKTRKKNILREYVNSHVCAFLPLVCSTGIFIYPTYAIFILRYAEAVSISPLASCWVGLAGA